MIGKAAADPRSKLIEQYSEVLLLPRPLQGHLIVELPKPPETNDAGLYVGSTMNRNLSIIPNQYLVHKGPPELVGEVVQCSEHALRELFVYPTTNGERCFGYVKETEVYAVIPLGLSLFHVELKINRKALTA